MASGFDIPEMGILERIIFLPLTVKTTLVFAALTIISVGCISDPYAWGGNKTYINAGEAQTPKTNSNSGLNQARAARTQVGLKPENTGAQLSLGRNPDRSQAGRLQQGDGPWNGNYIGWKKRGYVWFKIVRGGNAFLGGIRPVPGEVWREVRWAGGEEAIVVVHIKSGRTLILTGKVKEST